MIYLIIAAILAIVMFSYFKLADRFNIIDKPNERSSHRHITIRGGGVIFVAAALLWFAWFGWLYPWFIGGLSLIALVSFLDDRFTLPALPRIVAHVLSVALMFWETGLLAHPWFWWVVALVLVIGWINAFNFMDGINGITVLYALCLLLSFYLMNLRISFVNSDLLLCMAVGTAVFGFVNLRRRALAFAGDVGSVSMAFVLAFVMILLMIETGRWEYITFFAVYGVDAVITIIHRLMNRENIFMPHRSHLYQYLANEMGWSHLRVSALYAVVQMVVNLLIIYSSPRALGAVAFFVLWVLASIYILARRRIITTINVPED